MTYQNLSLEELVVNRDNDRHGPMETEDHAIAWLLERRADHMRRLAADIADAQQIYEPPLVRKEEAGYVVYDGNRRIVSLKLLHDPGRAPTPEWTKFYSNLRERAKDLSFENIECRIEDDGEKIDEILYRRHTGSQGGVGQSGWDATAKHHFIDRTGRGRSINIARELYAVLRASGYSRPLWQIPISNVNRLLSGESQRNRLGLRLKRDDLSFTHEPNAALKALERIFDDLSNKEITLQDIWDSESKHAYLNRLEGEGVLPDARFALRTPILLSEWMAGADDQDEDEAEKGDDRGDSQDTGPAPDPEPVPPKRRTSLIPSDVNFELPKRVELTRTRAIWEELQFRLVLTRHVNAISVLFRVLIEFSADYYLNAVGETQHVSKNWTDRMKAAVAHQLKVGLIDEPYAQVLGRFQRSEELLSSSSMNKYVHRADLSPSAQHLCSVWDTLQRFLVNCVRA